MCPRNCILAHDPARQALPPKGQLCPSQDDDDGDGDDDGGDYDNEGGHDLCDDDDRDDNGGAVVCGRWTVHSVAHFFAVSVPFQWGTQSHCGSHHFPHLRAQHCPGVDVNALDQDNHPVFCAVCFLYLQVSLLISEDDL